MSTHSAYLQEQIHHDKPTLERWQYEAWSFQACALDPANPAFYMKSRDSYRDWGKNKQRET